MVLAVSAMTVPRAKAWFTRASGVARPVEVTHTYTGRVWPP